MTQETIELLLWLFFFFFIGCIIGYFLHMLFGADPEPAAATTAGASIAAASSAAKPASSAAMPLAGGQDERREVKPRVTGKPLRPAGIAKVRDGKPDNLQLISGVGPKLEKTLHSLGFFHFDQIAAWSGDEIMWVDEHLRFKGRIERDEWIGQCQLLAAGDMDKFSELYGSGGMKDADGKTRSGTRTRKS
jgi:NADH-quinone oxidoreductase subunit E